MTISSVSIRNLRNIESISFDPCSGINIISGPNGAGKTSILEAIYLLGRGRSFRTNQAKPIIREGTECVEVVGKKDGPPALVAGVRRCTNKAEIRINGESIPRVSELARHFPVQLVTPRSHELLERGPEYRRRFLDWGLFHVEQSYGSLVARYNRVLKQRNFSLKNKPNDTATWDPQIAEYGERIHALRGEYLKSLVDVFAGIAPVLGLASTAQLSLTCGWEADPDLLGGLKRKLESDRRSGFTSIGPHRDDMKVQYEGQDAADRLSRGQQKLLVLGLVLAQLNRGSTADRPAPILLIDDLAAELDEGARERVITFLSATGIQVFISSLNPEPLAKFSGDFSAFHVEHGRLRI